MTIFLFPGEIASSDSPQILFPGLLSESQLPSEDKVIRRFPLKGTLVFPDPVHEKAIMLQLIKRLPYAFPLHPFRDSSKAAVSHAGHVSANSAFQASGKVPIETMSSNAAMDFLEAEAHGRIYFRYKLITLDGRKLYVEAVNADEACKLAGISPNECRKWYPFPVGCG